MPGLLSGRDRTVPAFLRLKAERNGTRPALRFEDEVVDYASLYEQACRFAGGLRAVGVRTDSNVAVLMHNSLDFHRAWFGINVAGAVEVPVNTEYRGEGIAYLLNHSGAQVAVVDAELLGRIVEVQDQLTSLRTLVVRGPVSTMPALPVHSFADVLAHCGDEPLPERAPGDLAAIMYTSGTTGAPKGVMLPHGAAISWAEGTIAKLGLRPGETHYCCYPLFHTLAQYFATMPALGNDGVLALARRFSVSNFWADVRRFGAASANMMGSTVSLLHAAPPRADDAETPLRLAFGAPAPPAIVPEFERRFGLRFVEIYGSSEANVVLWNPLDDVRVGTCGKPIGAFDVRLVDEQDREVPTGVPGEIVTRPHEPFSMMSGYWAMPDKTVEAFRNLWFHTGDLARRDENGYYSFVDRKKDSIRRRGENISSWEIETIVSRWPQVAECIAYGVPSELSEEDVMVAIVPLPGEDVDLEGLVRFCAERMPRYMVPRYWELTDSLPRTQTGKVEKYRMRERGVQPSTWDRETRSATT